MSLSVQLWTQLAQWPAQLSCAQSVGTTVSWDPIFPWSEWGPVYPMHSDKSAQQAGGPVPDES